MVEEKYRYFLLNKPYNMVSQFASSHPVTLLSDLEFNFPPGTHAIGRLDNHSEGLLLLTTNKKITRLLFQGKIPHKRTYIVQVNNIVNDEKIKQLRKGVEIPVTNNKPYITIPCEATIIPEPFMASKQQYPYIVYPPYTWLSLTLTEGKFHQVRKMMISIKHRCKRLIRLSIEDICLGDIPPGKVKEITEEEFFKKLKL
ncbi:MAG: pseudouridine synthase [Chitinophagaceae bacterium]